MTATDYRRIVAARHWCEVGQSVHIGAPLWIRPARSRHWWRFGR
jgi:hypothetical protein